MPDFNDDLGDQFVYRAIDLERLQAGLRKKALALLKSIEQDLVVALAKGPSTKYQQARLQALLQQARDTIRTAYKDMRSTVTSDLQDLADAEIKFVQEAIDTAVGMNIISVEVSAEQLKAIVGNAHIEGGPQGEWWNRQSARTIQVFSDAVRKGLYQGWTTDKIVSSLRDSFSGMLRRNIEALVRTSVASVSNQARLEVYDQNKDVIAMVQQRSVLDARTTLICMAYSGKVWTLPDYEPVGHDLPFNGGVPRHWSCRSTIVPVLPSFQQLFGGKKKTVASAQQYFQQRMRAQGFTDDEIARTMTDAQASMKGSVPADLDYEGWLKLQPEAEQVSILGPGRFKLWKAGKLNFTQLVDQSNNPLTIAELMKLAS